MGRFKALTIKQPWAWAVVAGHKDIENRTWSTSYRGWLVIHAGGAIDTSGRHFIKRQGHAAPERPTRGAFIGIVELVDVTRGDSSPWAERGAVHWQLRQAHAFKTPIPARGALQLWTPSHHQTTAIMAQILQLPGAISDRFQ